MDLDGLFISFEGVDGAGKSTHHRLLAEALQQAGYPVVVTREPGGCPLAEEIRALLLRPDTGMQPRCEALLYAAARAQHVQQVILPALQAGKIVLCDRFVDSSLAYQGYARGLGYQQIFDLNDWAMQQTWPDLTFYLHLPEQVSAQRRDARHLTQQADRLEQEGNRFQAAVRQGFEQLQAQHPQRFIPIDATPDQATVHALVLQYTLQALQKRGITPQGPQAV